MTRARLDKLIDEFDPALQRAFLDAVYEMRDAAQIQHVTDMIARGDVEGALRGIGLDPTVFRAFDRALSAAFEAGGDLAASALPTVALESGLRVDFKFNVRNPEAERWLSENSSRLVTEILDDQRAMIRERLRAGIEAGDNPRKTALDLVGRVGPSGRREGGTIGLTSSQAEWAKNYEAELRSGTPTDALSRQLRDARFDAAVRRAEESGQPIPEDLLQKMVDTYENRALRYRAESIARTETQTAVHEAAVQAVDQAIDTGAIDRSALTKIWRATHDKRTRESHAEMDGQEVGWDENFTSGLGNELAYPGDPDAPIEDTIQCRCWMETRVDFLAGAS